MLGMNEILAVLWENEIDIEKQFYILQEYLQRIFKLLFKEPILPYFDWLLRVLEKPELAAVLGMPATTESGKQIRSLMASNSPFSETLRTQIAHRLYSVFQILKWLKPNPLRPDWMESYQSLTDLIADSIQKKYVYIKPLNKENMDTAWELNRWEEFHDVASLDISFLFPNLQYLNDPGAFGRDSKKSDEKNRTLKIFDKDSMEILRNFANELINQINLAKKKKTPIKDFIFVDFVKLLWSIDTFLLNREILLNEHNAIAKSLIDILKEQYPCDTTDPQKKLKAFDLDENRVRRMPAPEIYTGERTLIFSAGWALEIDLLCDLYLSSNCSEMKEPLEILKKTITEIAVEGIKLLAGKESAWVRRLNHTPFHLYSMCQRFWFFLECWHYRAIRSAIDMKKGLLKIKNYRVKPVVKLKLYFFRNLWKNRIERELDNFEEIKDKVKNNKKLPGTLYSIFILGGAGIGKTTIVKEVLKELYGAKEGVIRLIPPDIKNFTHLFKILNKYKGKFIIFFFDEIHLDSKGGQISPYTLMLDPLQEGCLAGSSLPGQILYIFASSAFKFEEEFKRAAREAGDIAMRDFATRIRHWIKLPDLWQIPEQKFILGYSMTKVNNMKRKIASLVTINAELKNVRSIERAVKDKGRLLESANRYVRGDILNFFI